MTEIEELTAELFCKGGPRKGKLKKNADPVKLARFEKLTDEAIKATKTGVGGAIEKTPQTDDGSLESQLMAANARADVAENKADRATKSLENLAGNKVPNKNKPEGEVILRPDEVMAEDLATVGTKSHEELSDKQKIAIEREIRRYVRRGYIMRSDKPIQLEKGYKDKISDADKSRADHFLKMLGRVDKNGKPILLWDESIVVPGFN